MADPRSRLCGSCCRGRPPMRMNFNESLICVCGAPFFLQIVAEDNLPMHRRCKIGIPMEFMEDHGSGFDRVVRFEEEAGGLQSVAVGGNLFVGFGFEWKDFVQTCNIGVGHVVVFTLVARSRFLVQVYDPALVKSDTGGLAFGIPNQVGIKAESIHDDIEVGVAQDGSLAKASKSGAAPSDNIPAPNVKVENSETKRGEATQAPKRVDDNGTNCKLVPKTENVEVQVENSETKRGEATQASKRVDDNGTNCKLVPKTETVEVQRDILEKGCCLNENKGSSVAHDLGGRAVELSHLNTRHRLKKKSAIREVLSSSEQSSSSTSDSAWRPRSLEEEGSKRRTKGKRALFSSNSLEEENRDMVDTGSNDSDGCDSAGIDFQHGDDEKNKSSQSLVQEAPVFKTIQDWAEPGTTRFRTYVSKRRPVSEAEKQKALDAARDYPVTHPSFLKQLTKDSCYRSTRFFPPEPFFNQHMIPCSRPSYVASLVDDEGKCWPTRIKGKRVHWKNFTLDHGLEEDDVTVWELVDSRVESFKFLVHIFRVVDVKVTLTGRRGWAAHYHVVEGTKKQWFEARRNLLKDQGRRKKKKKPVVASSNKRPQKDEDVESRRYSLRQKKKRNIGM